MNRLTLLTFAQVPLPQPFRANLAHTVQIVSSQTVGNNKNTQKNPNQTKQKKWTETIILFPEFQTSLRLHDAFFTLTPFEPRPESSLLCIQQDL